MVEIQKESIQANKLERSSESKERDEIISKYFTFAKETTQEGNMGKLFMCGGGSKSFGYLYKYRRYSICTRGG